jgi:hypothetical protein
MGGLAAANPPVIRSAAATSRAVWLVFFIFSHGALKKRERLEIKSRELPELLMGNQFVDLISESHSIPGMVRCDHDMTPIKWPMANVEASVDDVPPVTSCEGSATYQQTANHALQHR